ncbi:MAG: co-regulatory protein PtrA N-terminal domain-containing protein [Pseudomonas sp.]|uniref:co-regulatory protein PtrA N-terminal domain-containing protein n=1 Tax=Pseudomonas sp. TaxID=306 RepID=UPI003BB76C26
MGIAALTISSLAMAEGGTDRTFARMEQAGITATQIYQAAQQQKPVAPVAKSKPPMVDYANC